jgi:signal transduction histidine kinase
MSSSSGLTVQAISDGRAILPRRLVWVLAGIPIVLWMLLFYVGPTRSPGFMIVSFAALALTSLPALLIRGRREARLGLEASRALEKAEELKLELDTVRYRVVRLREELAAADSQARLSHQLTLLGRFTAGFLHEFNNPLAILTSRIEVLLDERKEDSVL